MWFFLRRILANFWPPHHRVDPRLHTESKLEHAWAPGSTAKCISESDKRWIDGIVKRASVFPLDCFIRFEFRPDEQTVTCYRAERINQPRLELGTSNVTDRKAWEVLWKHIYDHVGSARIESLEGEVHRKFVIWSSPKPCWDPYSVEPNAISIKLCISRRSTFDDSLWCGPDGPCTCH